MFDWTNRRVGEQDVQWFADGKRLLVAAGGDLFVVDIAKGRFEPLTQTAEAERDPKLSPDNRYVSFRRGPDLFTIDVDSKVVTRLTTNGSDTLLNGQLDWVYPEELDLDTAHWWSPDSRSIAYLQFDISREPIFPQVSLLNARGLLEPERYPKAGDPNADVRLGVVAATGGETKWMDLGDPRGFLLARVVWSPDSRAIMAERLNRVQNNLYLMLADAATGDGARDPARGRSAMDQYSRASRSFSARAIVSCGPASAPASGIFIFTASTANCRSSSRAAIGR